MDIYDDEFKVHRIKTWSAFPAHADDGSSSNTEGK